MNVFFSLMAVPCVAHEHKNQTFFDLSVNVNSNGDGGERVGFDEYVFSLMTGPFVAHEHKNQTFLNWP
jgi:hypothetical protein